MGWADFGREVVALVRDIIWLARPRPKLSPAKAWRRADAEIDDAIREIGELSEDDEPDTLPSRKIRWDGED